MSDQEQKQRQPPDSSAASEALIQEIAEAAPLEISEAQPNEPLVNVEKETLESARLEIENERLRDELEEARDVHDLRKRYTGRLFWLIVLWLVAVITFVTLTGAWKAGFSLSDSVLIAFITSTTVSVLGLFVLVAKWLYPSQHKDDSEQKNNKKE